MYFPGAFYDSGRIAVHHAKKRRIDSYERMPERSGAFYESGGIAPHHAYISPGDLYVGGGVAPQNECISPGVFYKSGRIAPHHGKKRRMERYVAEYYCRNVICAFSA